ncbi:M24 family metallopeptidase [Edaphobacter modestus]|uniref:Xaa-Pro dipeptidase n=1 Tax=Edaphobacter modestus TaxID=388466 RepID=A0A4Q7Z016_9BACT|nr:Xaa-Pro peptidase family protein [Edaphobacter modestus]RZU42891.1 Xaa-Pro dipeptidase [Edaphobacter modestus]
MPSRRSFLLAASAAAAAPSLTLQAQRPSGSSAEIKQLPPAIAALTSRRSEAVPISLEEREHRIERARGLLAKSRLNALVICTGTSLAYFTGLRWGQSERFFAWVLPATGSPFIVCPVFEEGRVRERMEATPATLPQASVTRVYTWNEDESPYALLAKALKDAGITTGKIGVEERTQFAFSDGIAHASPTLTAVSGTPVTAGCRAVKSPAELALMRLANDNTLKVYEAAWKSLEPGMTNRHVSDLISAAYERTGFPGFASCQVAEYTALPHGSLQPQVIREGQIILLDDGCVVEGYQSDISRSFVLGKATDKQKQVFDVVHKAQAAALAAGKAGAACHAVDDAARKVITDAGFGPGYKHFTHRLGHGIGMDGHEWPYLVKGNDLPLESGMTFSDEPGIYIVGEFGIRLEDDWVVTPSGGEMFTPQSPSLEEPFAKA